MRVIEKDSERKKKRCARKRANGERKEPNPVPSRHLTEGVETKSRVDFITTRSAVQLFENSYFYVFPFVNFHLYM